MKTFTGNGDSYVVLELASGEHVPIRGAVIVVGGLWGRFDPYINTTGR